MQQSLILDSNKLKINNSDVIILQVSTNHIWIHILAGSCFLKINLENDKNIHYIILL